MRKYIHEILFLSILLIINLLLYFVDIDAKTGTKILNFIIGIGLTFIIVSCLSIKTYSRGGASFISYIFDRKNYFKYKNIWYFTWVELNRVKVCRPVPFTFSNIPISSFNDTNDESEYKRNLKEIVQKDIEDEINIKLKKRFAKSKYKKYNEID